MNNQVILELTHLTKPCLSIFLNSFILGLSPLNNLPVSASSLQSSTRMMSAKRCSGVRSNTEVTDRSRADLRILYSSLFYIAECNYLN